MILNVDVLGVHQDSHVIYVIEQLPFFPCVGTDMAAVPSAEALASCTNMLLTGSAT